MGHSCQWAASAVILTTCSLSMAQGQGKKDVPRPNLAEVRFCDGSLVRMTLLQEDLEVMTKYGKLIIPFREVRRIDFGLHLPDGVGEHIDHSIKQLGSETYKDRDEAVKHLVHYGALAYPFVQRASNNPDPEVSQRASGVLKRITEKTAPENLRVKEDDYIQTLEFPITGRILHPVIKAHSGHFGELSLKLSDLRTLFVRGVTFGKRARRRCRQVRQQLRPVAQFRRDRRSQPTPPYRRRRASRSMAARSRAVCDGAEGLLDGGQRRHVHGRGADRQDRRERQVVFDRRALRGDANRGRSRLSANRSQPVEQCVIGVLSRAHLDGAYGTGRESLSA